MFRFTVFYFLFLIIIVYLHNACKKRRAYLRMDQNLRLGAVCSVCTLSLGSKQLDVFANRINKLPNQIKNSGRVENLKIELDYYRKNC